MFFYITIYFILSFILIINNFIKFDKNTKNFFYYLLILFFIFLIGLRDNVGGDWGRYKQYFDDLPKYYFIDRGFFIQSSHDYGYQFTISLFKLLNLDFYLLTLCIAILFMTAISNIAQKNKERLLTILIAFPFIILIVGMGYLRQGTALAFVILALDQLVKKNNFKYFLLMMFAISFHKSSVLFLGFYIFVNKTSLRAYLIFGLILLLSMSVIFEDIKRLYSYYVGIHKHLDSRGTLLRYLISFFPAIIFLFYNKTLSDNNRERDIYLLKSIIIISMLPMVFISSTFTDRILVYFVTIQLLVYPRMYRISKNFKNPILSNQLITGSIIILFFLYLYTWFSYSYFSKSWIPYSFYIIENHIEPLEIFKTFDKSYQVLEKYKCGWDRSC